MLPPAQQSGIRAPFPEFSQRQEEPADFINMAIGNEIFQHAGHPAGYMVAADNTQSMSMTDAEQNPFHAGSV